MRVFLSAGEASGDAYAQALVQAWRQLRPGAAFQGIGGPRLAATGADLVADSRTWGAIGIAESLKKVPRVSVGYRAACRALAEGRPGLFVPIDYGYLNIRLARRAKALGWKVLYFVPPGSWRRDRQGRDLPAITDGIVCPFPWSADLLRAMGANARFFGHPLRQLLRGIVPAERSGLAVLPGSRQAEIAQNLPPIAEAVRNDPRTITFALSPLVDPRSFRERWQTLTGRTSDAFSAEGAARVLAGAEQAIVCSGTATLEAALMDTPMVVLYRVSRLAEFESKLLRIRHDRISLPNILLDRDVIPELVQHQAIGPGLREALARIDGDAQRVAFEEIRAICGPEDAITQTAHWAVDEFRLE
jgi:lipid-A-disaccharide synthase